VLSSCNYFGSLRAENLCQTRRIATTFELQRRVGSGRVGSQFYTFLWVGLCGVYDLTDRIGSDPRPTLLWQEVEEPLSLAPMRGWPCKNSAEWATHDALKRGANIATSLDFPSKILKRPPRSTTHYSRLRRIKLENDKKEC